MSVKKRYLKSKPISKVTFCLPPELAKIANTAAVVGEFNNWDHDATPMTRLKSGDFKVTVDLEMGREYQYRFLLDGQHWENDFQADRYSPSGFEDAENSVVIV